MQVPGLRAVWSLHQSRAGLSSAFQQAALLLAPANADYSTEQLNCAAPPAIPSSTVKKNKWITAANTRAVSTATLPSTASASTTLAAAPTGAYSIEIAVQGFEKRYVDMACSVIDDIVMLAFAPKAYSALPTGSPSQQDVPLNLALGTHRTDVRLPWRRTRFTLIRGPFIDKQGMEQFERREYKSVLTAATNSDEELRRVLEALKIYQFTGVQLRLDITSAQRLDLPTDLRNLLASSSQQPSTPTLEQQQQQHKLQQAVGDQPVLGAPVVHIPAPSSPQAAYEAELTAVLTALRPLVRSGLQTRRRALAGLPEYSAWRKEQKATAAGAGAAAAQQRKGTTEEQGGPQEMSGVGRKIGGAAAPPSMSAVFLEGGEVTAAGAEAAMREDGGDVYGRLLRQRLQQQLGLLRAAAGSGPAQGAAGGVSAATAASYGLDPAVAAELLARIDAELLNTQREAAATTATATPAAGAVTGTIPDARKMSPADYVHAVLKYVQYVDSLHDTSGAVADAARADTELQVAAPGLALRLMQLWWAATSVEFKRHLGLPPAEVEARILEEKWKREEAEAAAAAEAEAAAAAATKVQAAAAAGGGAGAAQGGRQGEQGAGGRGRWGQQQQQRGGGAEAGRST